MFSQSMKTKMTLTVLLLGILLMSVTVQAAPLLTSRKYFLAGSLAAMLFSALIVWTVMKRLTAPLLLLARHIKEMPAITGGEKLIPIVSGDEIGTLANAFNWMLIELDEQKRELKEKVKFLEILMETIPSPIFYKDTQGVYIGCNAAFASLLGLPREEIIGESAHDVASKETADRFCEADTESFARQGVLVYESSIASKGGPVHDVIFFKTTFPNADPHPADLNDVVGKIANLLARLLGEDIEFTILPADRPLPVMADSPQIEQVLMNLATNARDAMPQGGDCRSGPAGWILVRSS